MSKNKGIKIIQDNKAIGPVHAISFGAMFVTLYFNTNIQDPFNSPKMWILLILAAWLSGYIVAGFNTAIQENAIKWYLIIAGFLLGTMFFASIVTDNKYISFIGETQRRNGFLAYASLILIGIASAFFFRARSAKKLYTSAFVTGSILSIYGLMQNSGLDIVKWNNPYNSIITTVGNPNFAAAVMAMMATIVFGPVLNKEFRLYLRFIGMLLTILLLITIYLSDARQGLISLVVGIGIYFVIWLFQLNKKLGIVGLISAVVAGIISILGMLQIGPLTSLLYKDSVSIRGYYWQTGIRMFRENFFTGVGFDSYGMYFKEYRDVGYSLKYGFNITSSNAHNLPIQMFATGGILVGIFYLVLTSYILIVGVRSIKSSTGTEKLLISSIFASWIAYQAQSIISIDNIGISIWGWVLGGAIIGMSVRENSKADQNTHRGRKNTSISLAQPIISMGLTILTIILISGLYRVEANMFDTRNRFNPQAPQLKQELYKYSNRTLESNLLDPNYKVNVGAYLIEVGFPTEGVKALKEVHIQDSRNLDALFYLAEFYQKTGNFAEAIDYRNKIADLDPWNSYNYLQLGRMYKLIGDFVSMQKMLESIQYFDTVSAESKLASTELTIS